MNDIQITNTTAGQDISVEYSSMRCSSDKWLLLVHPSGYFGLYTKDGTFIRLLESEIDTSSRPRWSRKNRDLFSYKRLNSLWLYDAIANASKLIHMFTEYDSIDDGGEADLSIDGEHRVLVGTKGNIQEVFVFDLISGAKDQVQTQTEAFDGLKITGSNRVIISRGTGLSIDGRQLTSVNGHACPIQFNGKDYILWCNSNEDPVTLPDYQNAVVMIDVETGDQIGLASFPWAYEFHISACSKKGFCIVSCDAPKNDAPGQIWKVYCDPTIPKECLIADTKTTYRDYTSQLKASVSEDGSRIYYTVDNGTTVNVFMLLLDAQTDPVQSTDPQWKPVTFVPQEINRAWQFKVRPNMKLQMFDVNPDGLSPIKMIIGNRYLFVATSEDDLEMFTDKDNK